MLRPLAVAASLSLVASADVPELVPELLKLSPHQESWNKIMNDRIAAGLPVPEMPRGRGASLASAAAEDILKVMRREGLLTRFWTPSIRPREEGAGTSQDDKGPEIKIEIRQQVLQAVQAEPAAIPQVLLYLPGDEAAATSIGSLYHLLPGETREQKEDQRSVRAWIYLHGGLLRGEVTSDAWNADWELYGGEGRKDPSLYALQARDPQAFGPLLEMLASHGNPGLAVLAARLLLEQAKAGEGEQWRSQLMWAVLDPTTPDEARQMAVNALLFCYWPERDAWILSNLELAEPGEISWYLKPVQDGRNHWIPALVKCLRQGNSYARGHAAELLMMLDEQERSPEILRALLPWLADPAWASAPGISRLRLIQAFAETEMPEAVAGLTHVVSTETDLSNVGYAAKSLARQHAKAAVPELKAALAKPGESFDRELVVSAIDALDGFSAEEVVAALEAYFASAKKDHEHLPMGQASADPRVDVGSHYIRGGKATAEKFGAAIKARAESLQKERPELSRQFLELMAAGDEGNSESVARRLSDGSITIQELDAALQHGRSAEGEWKTGDFVSLTAAQGATAGLAAVLSGDAGRIAAALKSEDTMTQAAAMAAARCTGDALDLDRVEELMKSGSPRVVAAASAYLQSSQEPEAHRLWDAIRQPVDATRSPYKELEDLKRILRESLGHAGEPSEIIGLESRFGSVHEGTYVVVYPDSALAVRDFGAGRIGTHPVTGEYLDLLHDYLATHRVDDLPSYYPPILDGGGFDYIHETSEKVRSLSIVNLPSSSEGLQNEIARGTSRGILIYYHLIRLLVELAPADEWNISYGPAVEVVIPAETSDVLDVWRAGDELQVMARGPFRTGRFRVDLKKKELTPPVAGGDDWSRQAVAAKLPPDFTADEWLALWQDKQGGGAIIGGALRGSKGLWLMRKEGAPELLVPGAFSLGRVSPDGKWCVAAKSGPGEAGGLVRINVETREVTPVNLPEAPDPRPTAYLAPRKKFLIAGSLSFIAPDSEPEAGGPYYLLDPVTGEVEALPGDQTLFAAYESAQPSAGRDEMWGAKPAGSPEDGTLVGRINGQALTFTPVWQVKGMGLKPADMWVDEKKEILYTAENGDLLKIDLKGMKIPVPKK